MAGICGVSGQITTKNHVANVLLEEFAVKHLSLIGSEEPSAYDDLKSATLAQSAMSRCETYSIIQHLDPGDLKPTDILMVIVNYARV